MLLIHRLFIKTALVFLLLGSAAGAWMLLEQAGVLPSYPGNLFTIHIHLIGIGFFLMMVCGVAMWMFPRKSGETREHAARDPLAWTTYFLLTGGLALRTVALLIPSLIGGRMLAASAFLQIAGVFSFVLVIWPRIYLPGARPPNPAPERK